MPVEFMQYPSPENTEVSGDTLYKMAMAYDGTGRRISKTRWVKARGDAGWSRRHVTHYTGIGTEIRENMPGGTLKNVRVVVNMPVFFRVTLTRLKPRSYIEKDILRLSNGGAILPKQSFGASRQGLGRYGVEDAADAFRGVPLDENGKPTSWSALNPKFEWYLKNHLGSTMLVYGTQWADHENLADVGAPIAAYDYRSFGEQVTLAESADKVTENFTGKELDDETQLDYFGARYLDPMLGMWTSVDPMRQFASPYLYAGNGMNSVNVVDPDGNYNIYKFGDRYNFWFSSRGGTFFFQQMQLQLFGTSLLAYLMSKDERLIESSNKPDMPSTILSLASDAIVFTKLIKVISVSPVTNFLFDKAGDLQNVNTIATNIEFWEFDNYMYNLTRSTSISGSSVDDVKAKAAWACEYGLKLYQNDVEIDDKVRQSFNEAYRNEFAGE